MLLSSSRTTLFVLNCSGLIRFSVIILGLIEKYAVCCEFSSGNSEFAGYSFGKDQRVGRKWLLWEIYWSPLCFQSFWSLICVIFFCSLRALWRSASPTARPKHYQSSPSSGEKRSLELWVDTVHSLFTIQFKESILLAISCCWGEVPDVTDTK